MYQHNVKAAMQYQNKTPEEIVRQYKKRLRTKQGLLILILLLYIIINIKGIWWSDDGMADVLLKLFIFIVITFSINVWASWDFMSLNLILNQDCNPVTYVQVMRLFLQAALVYEAIVAFPFHGEELMYWLTEEELETVRSGLEKQPFGLHGWLGMGMSF